MTFSRSGFLPRLEIESGSNDPMAVFLTVTLIDMLATGQTGLHWSLLTHLIREFGIGGIVGLGGGWLMLQMVNRINLATGLYPILVIAGGLVVFALTNALHGSGFLAVYLCGLVIGNRPVWSARCKVLANGVFGANTPPCTGL